MRYETRPLAEAEKALFEALQAFRGYVEMPHGGLFGLSVLAWHWWGDGSPPPRPLVHENRLGRNASERVSLLSFVQDVVSDCAWAGLQESGRGNDLEYVLDFSRRVLEHSPNAEATTQAWQAVSHLPLTDSARRSAVALVYELLAESGDGSARQKLWDGIAAPGLHHLISGLIESSQDDSVCNPTSGAGAVLFNLAKKFKQLDGVELNKPTAELSRFLLGVAGANASIEVGDSLHRVPWRSDGDVAYDTIVVDPPWGMRLRLPASLTDRTLEWMNVKLGTVELRSELVFLLAGLASEPKRDLVAVLPSGALFSAGSAKTARESILSHPSIRLRSVITLPSMYTWTRVECHLCVFSSDPDRSSVVMVDAASNPDCFEWSDDFFSSRGVEQICEAALGRGGESRAVAEVSYDEIAENDHCWLPRRYLGSSVDLPSQGEVRARLERARSVEADARKKLDLDAMILSSLSTSYLDGQD